MCCSGGVFLSSNQWKCVYQETVFDLDKCFTDVNKAGGRREKRRVEREETLVERTQSRSKVLR